MSFLVSAQLQLGPIPQNLGATSLPPREIVRAVWNLTSLSVKRGQICFQLSITLCIILKVYILSEFWKLFLRHSVLIFVPFGIVFVSLATISVAVSIKLCTFETIFGMFWRADWWDFLLLYSFPCQQGILFSSSAAFPPTWVCWKIELVCDNFSVDSSLTWVRQGDVASLAGRQKWAWGPQVEQKKKKKKPACVLVIQNSSFDVDATPWKFIWSLLWQRL